MSGARGGRRPRWPALLALAGLACVPSRGGWDLGSLREANPELARLGSHRLGDATPYPAPRGDGTGDVDLILCRWPDHSRVRVALPPSADPEERALLARAVEAWDAEGLGIRLRVAPPGGAAEIRMGFAADPGEGPGTPTATTGASCRLGSEPVLVRARVGLRRTQLDLIGRLTPLTPDELLGAALHELGHALGFQGHAARGASIMVRETEVVRRLAARVRKGEPLGDRTLRALYRVPSGVRVGRRRLDEEEARAWRVLVGFARRQAHAGPFAQVGDRAARLEFRDGEGWIYGAWLPKWPARLRSGGTPRLFLDPAARGRLLEGPVARSGPGRARS